MILWNFHWSRSMWNGKNSPSKMKKQNFQEMNSQSLVCYEYLMMDFGKQIWHIVNPWIDVAPHKGFTTFFWVWQFLWFVKNKEFDKNTHLQPLKLVWRVSTTCCGYETLPKWCLTYPTGFKKHLTLLLDPRHPRRCSNLQKNKNLVTKVLELSHLFCSIAKILTSTNWHYFSYFQGV